MCFSSLLHPSLSPSDYTRSAVHTKTMEELAVWVRIIYYIYIYYIYIYYFFYLVRCIYYNSGLCISSIIIPQQVTTATDDRAPDESLSRLVLAFQTGQYRSVHCFHSLQQLAACSRVCVCEASCARSAAYVQPQKLVAINTHSHETDVSTSFFLPLRRLLAGDCTFD